MKTRISSRVAAVTLAFLAVITLSSCGKKNDEAATSTSPSAGNTGTDSTSSAGGAKTAPSSTASSGSAQGVAPQGTNCPSGNLIKGVNSPKLGGKIALTTKSPSYAQTKAEKCFADTAAAAQAGYKSK
jgi:hypothetical protein